MIKKSPEYSFNVSASAYNYSIVMPHTSVVFPDPAVKFIYVMRKDSGSVCNPIASKISQEYRIPQEQVQEIVSPAYNRFVDGLSHVIGQNFICKGKTEIHLFAPESIETHRHSFLGQRQAISLDPLIDEAGIETIGLSRGYLPGGTVEIGMMPRPGFPSLHEQILAIKDKIFSSDGVDIFEDDIYTGGSLTRVVDMLANEGIKVKRIIPGIQIGAAQSLIDRGIEINPAIQYHMADGQDIDLGDPRDFLLGADGLVVILNGQQLGRLPYVSPFVSPSARLSIPKENEESFSRDVLLLNREFFAEVEQGLAIPLDLKHMNEVSAFALKTLMPEWKDARMVDIIDNILDRQNAMKAVCDYHRDRSGIRILGLPQKVVFLDVNGTILPSDSKNGHIADQDLNGFQNAVAELEKTGAIVGLNSDSPLPQLREFAAKLGIPDAPIIAENGAVLAYGSKKIVMRSFEDLSDLKASIKALAEKRAMAQADDLIAPEFGGSDLAPEKWAFGGNRSNSLSVFADAGFLKDIKALIDGLYEVGTVSCDYSPEHGFLGVHSGENFRTGKAETLQKLVREGHEIVSVGDSLSDYAPMPLPNRVVFVQDGLPADILRQPHVRVSEEKGISGVIETLKYFAYENAQPSRKQDLSYEI